MKAYLEGQPRIDKQKKATKNANFICRTSENLAVPAQSLPFSIGYSDTQDFMEVNSEGDELTFTRDGSYKITFDGQMVAEGGLSPVSFYIEGTLRKRTSPFRSFKIPFDKKVTAGRCGFVTLLPAEEGQNMKIRVECGLEPYLLSGARLIVEKVK
jgi:hypothetical protein